MSSLALILILVLVKREGRHSGYLHTYTGIHSQRGYMADNKEPFILAREAKRDSTSNMAVGQPADRTSESILFSKNPPATATLHSRNVQTGAADTVVRTSSKSTLFTLYHACTSYVE